MERVSDGQGSRQTHRKIFGISDTAGRQGDGKATIQKYLHGTNSHVNTK